MSQGPMASKVDVNRGAGKMTLEWQDGVRQDIDLKDLRRLCPCALCEGNRMAQSSDELHMITTDELAATAGITEIVPVGRYALQIRWDDGHDTGIYTYTYLRTLSATAGS